MHGVGNAILAALACAAVPASAWEPLWTSAWTYDVPVYAANPVQLFLAGDGTSFALVDVTYDSATHAVLAKFESDGTFAWTCSRDAAIVAGEALLDDSRVAVVGTDPSGMAFVRVVDAGGGSLLWERRIGDATIDPVGASDLHAAVEAIDGTLLVRARDEDDLVVLRFTADGTVLPEWRWTAPDGPAYGFDIAAARDGGAVVAGQQNSIGGGFATVRFDAEGAVAFADIELGDIGNPLGDSRVAVDADDATIVAASPETVHGVEGAQVWKIAADGTRLWTRKIPDPKGDLADLSAHGLALAPNGDAIVSVVTLISQNLRTVRLASADGAVVTDASSAAAGMPTGFALAANGRALIGAYYFIDSSGHVAPELAEFDSAGRPCRIADDASLHGVVVVAGASGWYVLGETHPPVTLQHFDAVGVCDGTDPDVVFESGFEPLR
ncbi:MAG TPA: hypothetical protein VHE32_08125 [Rhodanobacteraceae bacterium]|jgi:hypothetical protein|nr:hypothetical protein [Rhodanobacteraceae bacterium]